MGFEKIVPKNANEVFEKLQLLQKNWKYVKNCELAELREIQIGLSWEARLAGYKDFCLPVAEGKGDIAEGLLRDLIVKIENNLPITENDATELYKVLEHEEIT